MIKIDEDDLREGIHLVPEHLRDGVQLYLRHGIPPGGFLMAVLKNDLKEAVACADSKSLQGLREIVLFLYNYAPRQCWGSPELVRHWLEIHRMEDAKCQD